MMEFDGQCFASNAHLTLLQLLHSKSHSVRIVVNEHRSLFLTWGSVCVTNQSRGLRGNDLC